MDVIHVPLAIWHRNKPANLCTTTNGKELTMHTPSHACAPLSLFALPAARGIPRRRAHIAPLQLLAYALQHRGMLDVDGAGLQMPERDVRLMRLMQWPLQASAMSA